MSYEGELFCCTCDTVTVHLIERIEYTKKGKVCVMAICEKCDCCKNRLISKTVYNAIKEKERKKIARRHI